MWKAVCCEVQGVGHIKAGIPCQDRTFKLERFAVLKEYRGHGYGKQAFLYLVNKLEEEYNPCTIYFNAQYQLLDYYKSLGFIEEGETFYEANIKHIKMVKKI